MGYTHILVAVDLSEEAMQIGARAVDLARRHGARISLIHVVKRADIIGDNELLSAGPPLEAIPTAPMTVSGSEDEAFKRARFSLDQLAQRLGVLDVADREIVAGATRQEILRLATERAVDLIVVGTHGRHGLALLLGSTANAVLHRSPCDLLAVRVSSPAVQSR